MEICGEHGSDMAYSSRDCPACAQIEDMRTEHAQEIDTLTADFEYDIQQLEDHIEELESE